MKITVTTTQSAPPPPPPDAPGAQPASAPAAPPPPPQPEVSTLVNKTGVWSLFRLLDEAGRPGNKVAFYSGGKTYQYQFATPSAANPLNLTALRQFHCPAGI